MFTDFKQTVKYLLIIRNIAYLYGFLENHKNLKG